MSIANARTALLAVVADDRETRCWSLTTRAEHAASALLRDARRALADELRAHREAVRAHRDTERAAADARLQAAMRSRRQRHDALALAAAWAQLAPQLQQRWQSAAVRRAWIGRAIDHAVEHLPTDRWQIRVAPPWTADDGEWLRGQLARRSIADVCCVTDASLAAGVDIRTGDAHVDATPAGLLADRQTIEGRLLATMEAT